MRGLGKGIKEFKDATKDNNENDAKSSKEEENKNSDK
jgi:Sec-independent protein translocase protein TatA